tara:strand:- start:2601 stop:2960 length:360 start_codon:yes stop_codon:yes gene_type:complete
MSIEKLASNLVHARAAESQAKAARIEAEEAILAQYKLAEAGSQTVKTENGLKLTLKTSLGYKIDKGSDLPKLLVKKTEKIELNTKAYESLRESDPMEFSRVSKFVTTQPRKPSVTVAVL